MMSSFSQEQKYYEDNFKMLIANYSGKYLLLLDYSLRGVFNSISNAEKNNIDGKCKIIFCDPNNPPKEASRLFKFFEWIFYFLEFFGYNL